MYSILETNKKKVQIKTRNIRNMCKGEQYVIKQLLNIV